MNSAQRASGTGQTPRTIYLDADVPTLQSRTGATDRAVEETYDAPVLGHYDGCATDGWLSLPADGTVAAIHEQCSEASDVEAVLSASTATAPDRTDPLQ